MKFAVTALAISLAGFTAGAQAQQITGAGATFPAPVYTKWGEAAKAATGLELNYQAIGSGGGQNQILQRTVDFGASDAPMDAAKLESGRLLQFPTVMGSVVVIVNIPEVTPGMLTMGTMPPITVGNWIRPAASSSLGCSGLSEAPKSTVFALIWRIPPPEPIAW